MYELDYVKKRIRRRIAGLVAGIGSTGVAALSIIAFLGRYTGTFTVSVNNGEIALSLSTESTFKDPQSLLKVNEAYPYEEFTYSALPEDAEIDDETWPNYSPARMKADGTIESVNYFKYTFYVKNVGNSVASFNMAFNVTENVLSEDGRSLLDTLRVMVYKNPLESEKHEYEIYAKRAAYVHEYYDENGDLRDTYQEFVNFYPLGKGIPKVADHPLATNFVSDSVIANMRVSGFAMRAIERYTVVLWLEGEDPQSYQLSDEMEKLQAPVGASIKLGVEINAYEN